MLRGRAGEYVANERHGQGVFHYPDGSTYQGAWEHNKRHGFGVYTFPNGDVYEGEWEEGLKQGHGSYTYKRTGSKVRQDTKILLLLCVPMV